MRPITLALPLALLALPVSLAAQGAPAIGSAAAAFGTAVTEAESADAVLWNPAMLGISQGAGIFAEQAGTYRILAVSLDRAPGEEWLEGAARLGLLGGGPGGGSGWSEYGERFSGDLRGTRADLVWVASAISSLGISLSTHARGDGWVSGGDEFAEGGVRRSLTTVGAMALSSEIGTLAGMPVRAGMTAKGRWVHVHGRGMRSPAMEEYAEQYVEHVVRNVPGASFDVGMTLAASPQTRVSLAVRDAVRFTFRPELGPRQRVVVFGDVADESEAPLLDGSDDPAQRQIADQLYQETVPGTWLLAGVSHRSLYGTVAGAVEGQLKEGGLDGLRPETRLSASYALPLARLPLRVALAGGEGSRAWSLGWVSGGCQLPWSIAIGQEKLTKDQPAAMSISASFGARPSSSCLISH